jgi:hypothetical protein
VNIGDGNRIGGAGDPANNRIRHYIGGHLWNALPVDGDGYLTEDKVKILGDAVNAQCDALDGVKDGVLNDPRRCKFRPETLLCQGSDTSKCLTAAQVAAVEKVWPELRTPEGQQIYAGLVPGGEAGLDDLQHGHWSGDRAACPAERAVFPVLRVRRSSVGYTQLPLHREGRVRPCVAPGHGADPNTERVSLRDIIVATWSAPQPRSSIGKRESDAAPSAQSAPPPETTTSAASNKLPNESNGAGPGGTLLLYAYIWVEKPGCAGARDPELCAWERTEVEKVFPSAAACGLKVTHEWSFRHA